MRPLSSHHVADTDISPCSPDFGNRGILLAVTQDGADLTRPRLVVPGDVKGGRYVSDIVQLHITRTAP
ncbi:hypothetical protein [Pseudonocardia sp.]|uniref:hypothetical protein n=1 Tax=Pseudonocardia sp. TaxID=60912 RepID=UPI003D0C79BC